MLAPSDEAEPEPEGAETIREHRIQLDNPNRYPEASARRLRPWLQTVVAALVPEPGASLAIRFVSDREMRRLNTIFRGKDAPTDVLSFPGGESPEGIHVGDIAISLPAARRQAAERGHSTRRELEILLLHGILHCLGHDHEADDGEMARLERRLRRRWIGHDD